MQNGADSKEQKAVSFAGRPTSELQKELESTTNFKKYLADNEKQFVKEPISDLLYRHVEAKAIKKSELFRMAEISEVYGYQILAGMKHPERNKVISIAVALHLDLAETNTLLKRGGYAPLYVKNESDCIIMYGILHGASVLGINEALYDQGLPTLS